MQKLAIEDIAKKGGLDPKSTKIFYQKYFGTKKATPITMVKGAEQNLSVVTKVFHDLQKSFEEQLPQLTVLKTEKPAIKAVLAKRKDFIVQKSLFNPRYRQFKISDEEIVSELNYNWY